MYRIFENNLSITQHLKLVALRAQYKEWKDQEEDQPSPLGFHDVFTQESFEHDDEDAEQPRPDPSRPATESGKFPFQGINEHGPTRQLDPLLENKKGNVPDFVPTGMMDMVEDDGSGKNMQADNKPMVQHHDKPVVSHQPAMNQATNKQQPTKMPMVMQETTVPTTTASADTTKQQPAASGAAIVKRPTPNVPTTAAAMDWTKRMMTGDDPPRDPSRLDQKDEVILPCSE